MVAWPAVVAPVTTTCVLVLGALGFETDRRMREMYAKHRMLAIGVLVIEVVVIVLGIAI
jgi:uncharacterized membrane protein YcjF (UPF0283 family)